MGSSGAVTLNCAVDPCVVADANATLRVVPPALFGDQLSYENSGSLLWDRPISASCQTPGLGGGAFRASLLTEIEQLGVTVLRYPGGTQSDFFHWDEAVGPVANRVPQIRPFESTATQQAVECPLLGTDEIAQLAATLNAPLMITANVGTGTAAEAAGWLSHYRQTGVNAPLWEIGNEVYIPGIPAGDPNGEPYFFAAVYTPAAQYAVKFDEYAAALRAVDSTVKVGMVGPDTQDWYTTAFAAIQQRPDFLGLHVAYAPGGCADGTVPTEDIYRSMMAAPDWFFQKLIYLDSLVGAAPSHFANMEFAITEHASYFVVCGQNNAVEQVHQNLSLGSAIFTAMEFNVMMTHPRVTMANHINMVSNAFQAPINTSVVDGYSSPVRSAFWHVWQLYRAAVGGTLKNTVVLNTPTFSSPQFGFTPARTGVSGLHAVTVRNAAGDRHWVYVVNRLLDEPVTARVLLINLPLANTVTVEELSAPSYLARNSASSPDVVVPSTRSFNAPADVTLTFPPASLTRVTFQ